MHLPWRYLQVTHGILKAGPSTFQQAGQTWHGTDFASQNSDELSMLIECVRWLRESKFSHLWLANICIAPEMNTLEYFSHVLPKLDNEILGNPIFRQSIHVAPSNCTKTAAPTGTEQQLLAWKHKCHEHLPQHVFLAEFCQLIFSASATWAAPKKTQHTGKCLLLRGQATLVRIGAVIKPIAAHLRSQSFFSCEQASPSCHWLPIHIKD